MKTIENLKNATHQQVQLLLPWYVNDTLQTDEKALVESHIKLCLQCRAEIVELQKISRIVCDSDPLSAKAHSSFAELTARIHESNSPIADQAKKTFTWAGFKHPIAAPSKKFSFSGYAVFAQAAMVLLAIIGLIHFNGLDFADNPNNRFYTLSSSSNEGVMENEIRVVFSKTAKQAQIDQTLLSLNGEIISGPSQQGVYVIRINDVNLSGQEISELVAKLRSHNHIIFAEPTIPALLQSQSG